MLPEPRRLLCTTSESIYTKRYVTVCALNKGGEVVAEYRRLSNTAEAVLGFLERLKGPVAVALEATLHWAWLHDLLSGAG